MIIDKSPNIVHKASSREAVVKQTSLANDDNKKCATLVAFYLVSLLKSFFVEHNRCTCTQKQGFVYYLFMLKLCSYTDTIHNN